MSGFLLLVPFLELFSFCWFVLSNLDGMVLVFSFYLLCFVICLRSLFFPIERLKGSRSQCRKWGEVRGGIDRGRERGNGNQNVLYGKII